MVDSSAKLGSFDGMVLRDITWRYLRTRKLCGARDILKILKPSEINEDDIEHSLHTLNFYGYLDGSYEEGLYKPSLLGIAYLGRN